MIKMVKEFGAYITRKDAEILMKEYELSIPQSNGTIRYAITIIGDDADVYLSIFDEGAETLWEVDIKRRLRRHIGTGEGCFWTDWESLP